MMWRRRPIPRRAYPWLAYDRGPSLRYELIGDGAVRRYPDGREVCVDSYAGRREYLKRLELMLKRQEWKCCLCGKQIRSRDDATFEHQRRRRLAGAFRNDATADADGNPINGAAHWICNHERG
jgi:hypothetical protein